MSTWCKICGIKSPEVAEVVAAAGADAMGLNFYPPSTRYVTPEQAAVVCRAVTVQKVGLFVDADAQTIDRTLKACPLDTLQFQGEETPDFCRQFGMPYIKSLRVKAGDDVAGLIATYADAWAILLDAHLPGEPGGTGQQFDWSLWPHEQADRCVLAGGLSAANVAAAIVELRPFGVDVCSGVEAQKGVKDPLKIKAFVEEVRHVG